MGPPGRAAPWRPEPEARGRRRTWPPAAALGTPASRWWRGVAVGCLGRTVPRNPGDVPELGRCTRRPARIPRFLVSSHARPAGAREWCRCGRLARTPRAGSEGAKPLRRSGVQRQCGGRGDKERRDDPRNLRERAAAFIKSFPGLSVKLVADAFPPCAGGCTLRSALVTGWTFPGP